MDYCSACRRILNGALVCPGCGAYAPDIAPPAHHSHGTAASTATASHAWRAEEWPAPGSCTGTHHAAPDPIGSGASGDAMVDASATGSSSGHEGTASTGQGRAARRRQLARWKKNKRRAVAATAVALVGGGLTVAALPATRASNSHTHAASPPEPVTAATPRTATTDSVSEQPDTEVPRHPSPHRPATTSRQQSASVAVPHTATPSRQPKAAATASSPATSGTTPHTTPESATGTHTGNAETPAQAQAPATTPPASTEHPASGPSAVHLLPITSAGDPTSPTQICLIAVCIG
ncbi:SCO2400 family protein [Streptomyces sp. NPDC005146]